MTEGLLTTHTVEQRAQAILGGRRGQVNYDYQLWRSNKQGDLISLIGTVEAGSVTMSNFRDHSWELGINMRADQSVELFSDYVKVIVRLRDGEDWIEYPMGNYVFDAPSGADEPAFTTWDLTGKSAESVLLADAPENGYKVRKGTGVLEAVTKILTDEFGILPDRIDFPPEDVDLTSDAFFTPYQDFESARWLRICNALLASGGFYALFTGNAGMWRTIDIGTLRDTQESVNYGTGEGYEPLIEPPISWAYNDEAFENKVVVYAGDANTAPPVIGAAELHSVVVPEPNAYTVIVVDPDSPFAIERYGRVVSREPVILQNIVATREARKVASRQLKLGAGMNLLLNVSTVPDPRRRPREVYRLRVINDAGVDLYTGKWRVNNWALPLDLSAMSHELARSID